jgi:hypothetical protein
MATRWASDDFPGRIEVFIQDSRGNPHLIVEKVPILMDVPMPSDSSFPIELWIAAEMTQVVGEEVDIALSHSVETVDGVRRLTVSAADVIWP